MENLNVCIFDCAEVCDECLKAMAQARREISEDLGELDED